MHTWVAPRSLTRSAPVVNVSWKAKNSGVLATSSERPSPFIGTAALQRLVASSTTSCGNGLGEDAGVDGVRADRIDAAIRREASSRAGKRIIEPSAALAAA